MLTKQDLLQIREVIQDEIKTNVRPIMQEELIPVKKNLDKLQKDFHSFVDHFDIRLTKVERDTKDLQQN